MADVPAGPAPPRWKPLDPIQRRVLGVLIEKAKTTPAGYPMSVNAIVSGCNQKNNRDPVMELDDFTVEKALSELRDLGAVLEVDWMGRVSKFKHEAYTWLGISRPEAAVMGELLLRGAQSVGDLRGRAARMEPIEDLTALRPLVDALVGRGLMIELTPPGRGQMVSHNLYLPGELKELRSGSGGHAPAPQARSFPAEPGAAGPAARPGGDARLEALATEVARLRDELSAVHDEVRELRARLDRGPE
jgi:uncharacterized protein YceH (UPF0502 family)